MLAGRLFVTPPTLVGVIDRLEAKKLVSRAPDATDRRKIGISLTAAGRRKLVGAPVPAQAQLARALRHVPAERLRAFHKTLVELAANMEAEKLRVPFFFSER
jgi:DNA-binding MarR family transcriptional regulator